MILKGSGSILGVVFAKYLKPKINMYPYKSIITAAKKENIISMPVTVSQKNILNDIKAKIFTYKIII